MKLNCIQEYKGKEIIINPNQVTSIDANIYESTHNMTINFTTGLMGFYVYRNEAEIRTDIRLITNHWNDED
jgi:hypothetical protein